MSAQFFYFVQHLHNSTILILFPVRPALAFFISQFSFASHQAFSDHMNEERKICGKKPKKKTFSVIKINFNMYTNEKYTKIAICVHERD